MKVRCAGPAPAQSLSLRLMEPCGVWHKKPVVRSRLTVSELNSVWAVWAVCAGLQRGDNVPLASAPGVTPTRLVHNLPRALTFYVFLALFCQLSLMLSVIPYIVFMTFVSFSQETDHYLSRAIPSLKVPGIKIARFMDFFCVHLYALIVLIKWTFCSGVLCRTPGFLTQF